MVTKTATTKTETPTTDVDPWDALIQNAQVEQKSRADRRPPVEVPAKILEFATKLAATGQVATVPVRDASHFAEVKAVFQSAADKLDKSATCREIADTSTGDDGAEIKRVTGMRLTIGKRRGAKGKDTAPPAPAA